MARIVARTVAVVLALVGVALLVFHPAHGDSRTEARVTVASPLLVSDATGAIRARARDATVTADGRDVTISQKGSPGEEARDVVDVLARGGLDAARRQLAARETRRADTARADRATAARQLATLASRTGFTDPAPAYQQKLRAVENLERQQAAAESAGQPHADIDAQLALSQQDAFELKLQVTRHTELISAEATADRRQRDATSAIDAAGRAASSASIEVSEHAAGHALSIAIGVALLVIAGIGFFVGGRLPRRAERRTAEAEIDLRESTTPRYLTFYRALASSPPAEGEPARPPIDLAHEEALDELAARQALEEQARERGRGRSRPR